MKAKTFENLIRKIVREEIDYSLRREIKSLKEDIRDELKPTIIEHKEKMVKTPSKPQISKAAATSLKEKIMGNKPLKRQNFAKDSALNDLLNETAQGSTNLETTMDVSMGDPFTTKDPIPTEAMPSPVQDVVNRDYRSLMKAIDKKKGR